MKKYPYKKEDKRAFKWSDGFSNSKKGQKSDKPKKNDKVEFEDEVVLIDEDVECGAVTGGFFFVLPGKKFVINGKSKV